MNARSSEDATRAMDLMSLQSKNLAPQIDLASAARGGLALAIPIRHCR
jgi:hypothetical protein